MQESHTTFSDPRIVIGASDFNRAGAEYNLRDTQEYEDLEARLHAMEAEGPAVVDWPEVTRLCLFIIESYGKDLGVGCWLAYALFRVEGYRGLAVGLGLLREMIGRHWATMQPPVSRKRARIGALEWLAGRAAHLCTVAPREDDASAILYAFDALGDIDQLVTERMTRDTFSLRELTRALALHRDAIRRARAEAERQREEEEAARNRLPVPTPATPAKAAPPPVDPATVESLPETLRTLSASLLGADSTDARAYVLSRVASWWRIRQVPPNEGGRTTAMPPVEEATTLRDLCRSGQDPAALAMLNELVWTAPFWFEGHRITAELLLRLGRDHADAHAAVCGTMPLLLRRLPDLVTFTFADGTPLAEPETRAWLAECGGHGGGSDDSLDRALIEVRHLLSAGKGKEAVDRMAALTRDNGSGSGRDRLLRQIAQARFCLDVGLVAAALPLLDHLDQLLEAHNLESWEPTLAAQVAELRFRALTHADAFKLVPEERRRMGLDLTRQRLVRLDFATAARLFR